MTLTAMSHTVSHAMVSHRAMSCMALSRIHALHSSGLHRTDHGHIPPSGALHKWPAELRPAQPYPVSSDTHSSPRASPSTSTQPSTWGWPGATGHGLLVQALSHFRAHPTQPRAFARVMFFLFFLFFVKICFQNKQKKLYLQVHKESGMDPKLKDLDSRFVISSPERFSELMGHDQFSQRNQIPKVPSEVTAKICQLCTLQFADS